MVSPEISGNGGLVVNAGIEGHSGKYWDQGTWWCGD